MTRTRTRTRTRTALAAAATLILAASLRTLAQNVGSLDATFNASTDVGTQEYPSIYGGFLATSEPEGLIVQPDGKILVGGLFARLNGTARQGIARLNADGSTDEGFNASVDRPFMADTIQVPANVSRMAHFTNGNILIGGSFTSVNGVARRGIARLKADGSLDAGFNADVNYFVSDLAVQPNGRIIVAGAFSQADGAAHQGIARFNADGSLDESFAVVLNQYGSVATLALQPDGRIIIGGDFNSVNAQGRVGLARLFPDGSVDGSFVANTRRSGNGGPPFVGKLFLQPDGKVLASGAFTQISGVARTNVARLNPDGTVDGSFVVDPSLKGFVSPLILQPDGRIILAVQTSGTTGALRSSVVRVNPEGGLDGSFAGSSLGSDAGELNNDVATAALQADGGVLIGGNFASVNGQSHRGLARLYGDVFTPAPGVVSVVGDTGQSAFVVTRQGDTSQALTVFYHVGGAAIGGVDYDTLPGFVTLPAGSETELIPIFKHTDHAKVKVFLDAGAGYTLGKAQGKLVLANL